MKATENYGFPYPECDPPLVKDSSQIAQVSTLAFAIDDEMTRIVNLVEDGLTKPAALRLRIAASTPTTDTQLMPVFTNTDILFQNTNGSIAFTVQDGSIRVNEAAWYFVGAHADTNSATAMQVNVRLTLNGSAVSAWGNPGSPYAGAFQLPALSAAPLRLNADDVLNMELKHNAAAGTAWNYRPHLWIVRLLAT